MIQSSQLNLFPNDPIVPDNEAAAAASPHTPSCPPFPSAQKPNPFSSAFDHFTLEQRKQIIVWNEKHTYDETIDLIQKHFAATVSRSALGRFHARTAFIRHIDETPDTQAAADEILLHITDKNHPYTAASLHILEQTAFKLSLTCADQPSHLDLLTRLNTIICRARNTAVRERHATVQETKCDLRREELALKRSPRGTYNNGGTRSPSPIYPSRADLDHTNATSPLPNPGRGTEHVSAQANISSEVFHPCPTLESRGTINPIHATRADQTAQDSEPRTRDLESPTPADQATQNSGLRTQNSVLSASSAPSDLCNSSPFSLPPEVLANNALYHAKLDCGEIIDIFAPGELARVDYCNPADQQFFATREKSGTARFVPDPNRTHYLPPLRNFQTHPITPRDTTNNNNLSNAA